MAGKESCYISGYTYNVWCCPHAECIRQ